MLSSFLSPVHRSASPIVKINQQKFIGNMTYQEIFMSGSERKIFWLRKCEVVLQVYHDDILITNAGGFADDTEYLSALRLMSTAQKTAERLKITGDTLLRLEAHGKVTLVPYLSDLEEGDAWLSTNGQKIREYRSVRPVHDVKPKEVVLGQGIVWSSAAGSDNDGLMKAFLDAWSLPIPFESVVIEKETFTVSEEPRTVCTL